MAVRKRFGPFELRPDTGELFRDGIALRIPEQPLQVLTVLVARHGELVTRDALRETLWSADTFVDFDLGLNKAVAKLRDLLGDSASSPTYIETIPKRGYRFIAPVADEVVKPASTAPSGVRPSLKRRHFMTIVVAALFLIGAAWFVSRDEKPASAPVETIAVLPFRDLSADPRPLTGENVTAEIIARLQRLRMPNLSVLPAGNVLRASSNDTTSTGRGRELGADFVVDGTFVRDGNTLRASASLVRLSDGRVLWSTTTDRTEENSLYLQNVIARKIAHDIELALVPERVVDEGLARSSNAEARAAFLRGEYLRQRQRSAPESIGAFERAIALDPEFAEAYISLADSIIWIGSEVMYSRARAMIDEAIRLKPESARAHAVRGMVLMIANWDWNGARLEFDRARELGPSDAQVIYRYAHYLAATGQLSEAIATAKRAHRLDPESAAIRHYLGRLYYFDHQYDNALYEWYNALQLDPDHYWSYLFISFVQQDRGAHESWFKTMRAAAEMRGENPAQFEVLEAEAKKIGYEQLAWKQLLQQEEAARRGQGAAYSVAIGYAKRGHEEKALSWLDRALKEHPPAAIYVMIEPAFDGLRETAEFQKIASRTNLPAAHGGARIASSRTP